MFYLFNVRVPHPIPLSKCDIPEHRKVTVCQQKNAIQTTSKFEGLLLFSI
jgi:hypothetical protein